MLGCVLQLNIACFIGNHKKKLSYNKSFRKLKIVGYVAGVCHFSRTLEFCEKLDLKQLLIRRSGVCLRVKFTLFNEKWKEEKLI